VICIFFELFVLFAVLGVLPSARASWPWASPDQPSYLCSLCALCGEEKGVNAAANWPRPQSAIPARPALRDRRHGPPFD
jgi:hypothetical protein